MPERLLWVLVSKPALNKPGHEWAYSWKKVGFLLPATNFSALNGILENGQSRAADEAKQRRVQVGPTLRLDFTLEIPIFYRVLRRCHNKIRKLSPKQHIKYLNFWCKTLLHRLVEERPSPTQTMTTDCPSILRPLAFQTFQQSDRRGGYREDCHRCRPTETETNKLIEPLTDKFYYQNLNHYTNRTIMRWSIKRIIHFILHRH